MKKQILGCITVAALAAACGEQQNSGFPQPANTVPVNFTIDASGRKDFYADEDLEWKGSFTFDKETRVLTYSADWAGGAGPYAPLYDDGPWTKGGHEPEGATANDDKFGITAFVAVPTEALKIEYGAQTKSGGWIWKGSNGAITLPANATTAVTAEGLTLTPEGTVDLRLTLDTKNLGSGFTFASGTPVKVKGTFADWSTVDAFDDATHGDATAGDGVFTYTMSSDATRRLKLVHGDTAEFIWMLGDAEYKNSTSAEQTGVKAYTKDGAATAFTEQTVIIAANKNTAVAVP